jgi:hypothetical protein
MQMEDPFGPLIKLTHLQTLLLTSLKTAAAFHESHPLRQQTVDINCHSFHLSFAKARFHVKGSNRVAFFCLRCFLLLLCFCLNLLVSL